MNYEIAIPTYNRPELIQKAALAYLEWSGVSPERVTIWVSGQAQRHLYDVLPEHWQARIQIGVKGLMANRAFAEAQYPEGTEILWLNDDVFHVVELDGQTLKKVMLQKIGEEGFLRARQAGANLWGIYAVHNAFYMERKVRTDLCYLTGSFYGNTIRRDQFLYPVFGDAKEDYERALRFFTRDGLVLRMDYYAPKTIYYNSPEIFPDRATVENNIRCLEELWPDYVRRNARRSKGPWPEILISSRGARAYRKKFAAQFANQ
jgi:hypothetical protein